MVYKLSKYVRYGIFLFCREIQFATRETYKEHCGWIFPATLDSKESRWWKLFEWRSLQGRPGYEYELDAAEQDQVNQVSKLEMYHIRSSELLIKQKNSAQILR